MKRLMALIKSRLTLVALVTGACMTVLVGSTTAVVMASIPDSGGVIHGCYKTASGVLRLTDNTSKKCGPKEAAISWDQHGNGTPLGPRYGDLLPMTGVDASGMDLSFRKLNGSDFTNTNLSNALLSGSDLSNSNFSGATIDLTSSHVNFTGAKFTGAVMNTGAYLTDSNFSKADLAGVNLGSLHLEGSNFSGANFTGATLGSVNLKGSTGLESATLSGVTWSDVSCPDGTNSDTHSNTCAGHLTP
jgi:hypothetical protein